MNNQELLKIFRKKDKNSEAYHQYQKLSTEHKSRIFNLLINIPYNHKGGQKTMVTMKQDAQAYEPQKTRNIAELEAVSVEQEIKEEERENKEKEKYTVAFIVVNDEEYRVPNSVREQLKTILEEKPDMRTFKVTKKGEGLNTSYTVIQLE